MFLNSPFKSCYKSLFMVIDSASIIWNVTPVANGLAMFHNHIILVRFKKSSLTAFSRGKSKSSFRTVWTKRKLFRFLTKILTLRY